MAKANVFILLCLELTFRSCNSEFTPVIKTNSGSLRGQTCRILGKPIFKYLGVPYATPPVGNLRFGKPLAVGQWDGVYEATEQPLPCVQKIKYSPYPWKTNQSESSEDCLYLNIWTPELIGTGELRPVLVWIYGGSFTHGSIDIDFYDGSVLSAYGDVVVASMNYRVGLFGFLNAGTKSCPGNMGLHDQLLAMKWIKENIEFFGGDPKRITLFGESAGAISIGAHLVSPLSRGLFARAILQSGSLYGPIVKGRDGLSGRSKVSEISKHVGCLNDEDVDIENMVKCLKTVPAEELLGAAKEKRGDFGPTFGDDYIPIDPNEAFKTGSFQNVELLIGANRDEGSHFLPSMFPQIFDRRNDETDDVTKGNAALYMEMIFRNFPDIESELVAQFYLQNISVDDHVIVFILIFL
ncbi:acetylcholinesterase-1-like [Limulus polyphemus]|uniref:Carboxylic ester hydrolase n=1 Tax=Limulus polyphemus TaxID=6850 RepID=A0ABM1C3D9_LIMPO|nr:acetylcholinesterase-1-like [Limulus polyphemus]